MAGEFQKSLEGKYELLSQLHDDRMGTIYKVRHRVLDEVRVVKVVRPPLVTDRKREDRFKREAKLAVRLHHPNVVELHDFSMDEHGSAYTVTEFIDGITVRELLDRGSRPSLGFGVRLVLQCLSALAYLHHEGIVHCNLGSQKLMLTRQSDGEPLIKLIDLGVARYSGGESQQSGTGVSLGQWLYSAPERFQPVRGGHPDERSDIYSVGVILYELLTGRLPFSGRSFTEQAVGHLFHRPREFGETDPDRRVPDELRQLVFQALEKDPADRMATAEDFGALLGAFDPGGPLKNELDQLMAEPGDQPPQGHSSTQARMDEQFGLGEPSAEQVLAFRTEDRELVAVNPAELAKTALITSGAAEVDALLEAGDLAGATRCLEELSGQVGQHAALTRLAKKIPAAGSRERLLGHLPSLAPPSEVIASCFISYSHDDSDFALRLCERLEERGIRCWLDEKDARVGDPIQEAVDQGLEAADRVLLCCSRASLSSTWVHREINKTFAKEERLSRAAKQAVRALIPLNLDGYLFEEADSGTYVWADGWSDEIRNRLAADFTGWQADKAKFEAAVEKVVESLTAGAPRGL